MRLLCILQVSLCSNAFDSSATHKKRLPPVQKYLLMNTTDSEPSEHLSQLDIHEAPPLSQTTFFRLRKLILQETGIALGENKIELLRNRLRRRLVHHGLTSFADYYELLRGSDPHGHELNEFINRLTTNKTDFFREPHHFQFLSERLLPEVQENSKLTGCNKLRIWSAACSTGEEPYSIAMSVFDFFGSPNSWDVKILASDVDSKCLETATSGTYLADRVQDLTLEQKRRWFQRGTGASEGFVRIRRELRESIAYRRINFVDPAWPIRTHFDAIFCRNALIYFERDFQHALVKRLLQYLKPNGYLFFGHSENLAWMPELRSIGQTIYVSSNNREAASVNRSNQTTLRLNTSS